MALVQRRNAVEAKIAEHDADLRRAFLSTSKQLQLALEGRVGDSA